jgi:hypothetical protein
MADTVRTLRVELEAQLGSFTKQFAAAGKSVEDLGKKFKQLRSAEMDAMHSEALKLNAAFEGTGKRVGTFADSVGRTATVLARSADAFGLPAGALRSLDDVMDVAEIGFGNLTKSAAGFNAASLGVAGAGLAMGVAIGSMLNKFKSVRETADEATTGLYNFLAAQGLFGEGETVGGRGAGQEAAAKADSRRALAQQKFQQQELLKGSEADIVAKLKQRQATEDLAKASDLLGFKITNVAQAQRVLAIEERNSEAGQKRLAAERKKAADEAKRQAQELKRDADALASTLLAADKDFHTQALKTWDEWGKRADENIKNVIAEYLRISSILGPTTGEIEAAFSDLQASAGQRGGLFQLDDAELTTFNSKMEELGDTGKLTSDQWGVLGDAYTLAMKRGIIATEDATAATKTWGQTIEQSLKDIPDVIIGALQGGGDVFKAFGAKIGADLGAKIGKNLKDAIGGKLGSALGSLAGPLGSVLGSLAGGLIDKLGIGGNKVIMEVNDLRDAFFEAQGGFEELQKKLVGLTDQDLVKKIFDARTVEDFDAAVKEVLDLLDLQRESQAALQSDIDKYGITVEELGPKWAQQKMDERAADLIGSWKRLSAAGVEVGTLVEKMGPDMNGFVQESLKAGTAIPEAMRPMLLEMARAGKLLKEDGTAFTEAEVQGLSFSQTMTEQFTTLIEKIDAMVNALLGIPSDVTTTVHVNTEETRTGDGGGAPPSPDGVPVPAENSFAAGTRGFVNFGRGTMAMLHGWEAVIPRDSVRGSSSMPGGTTIIQHQTFNDNPLQTYESQVQLRDHTAKVFAREASRDLAGQIIAGEA